MKLVPAIAKRLVVEMASVKNEFFLHKCHKGALGSLLASCAILLYAAVPLLAKPYNGGELFSRETFRFGKFESRMLMPAGSGLVSSMFTYYNDSYLGAPEPWREIDTEVLGNNPNQFQSNMITGNAARRITSEGNHPVPGGAHLAYNTYGIEWTPDYISWTVNGVEVRRATGAQIVDMRDTDQNLRFNLWAANIVSWVGAWNNSILPVHQYINWVQVSRYTPGAGPNGSDFTLAWREDFNSWDSQRWGVADWTFAENRADFAPDNVEIKEGILILSLTLEGTYGHNGVVPQDGTVSLNQGVRPAESVKGMQVKRQGRDFQVQAPGNWTTVLEVRTLQGKLLHTQIPQKSGQSTSWNFDASQLPPGSLLLRIPGLGQTKTVLLP